MEEVEHGAAHGGRGVGTELLVLETAEMCVKAKNMPQINFVV